MIRKVLTLAGVLAALTVAPAFAAVEAPHPIHVPFSFDGPFGTFDQAQLQRGYKVYKEVCSACHAMKLLSFRNLAEKDGPFYSEKYKNPNENPYVKKIASEFEVADIDSDTGDAIKRKATPADHFPSPYPNDEAAKASNGGALPPDQSVLAKARHGGPAYIYSILLGYETPPAALKINPGQYYNKYMAGDLTSSWSGDRHKVPEGGFIKMPPPLTPDRVTYDDGTKATLEQEAQDVSAFLAWASEPKQIERKRLGLSVLIYLVLLAMVTYAAYRTVWRGKKH